MKRKDPDLKAAARILGSRGASAGWKNKSAEERSRIMKERRKSGGGWPKGRPRKQKKEGD